VSSIALATLATRPRNARTAILIVKQVFDFNCRWKIYGKGDTSLVAARWITNSVAGILRS
jgi:hypothetical protein